MVDASAVVDLLVRTAVTAALEERLRSVAWHAPAHVDAEVLSALGRLHRAGHLTAHQVSERLDLVATLPLHRESLTALLPGAWARRADLRLVDAVYVELAARLGLPLVTTDHRLARATPFAEGIRP